MKINKAPNHIELMHTLNAAFSEIAALDLSEIVDILNAALPFTHHTQHRDSNIRIARNLLINAALTPRNIRRSRTQPTDPAA